MILSVTLTAIVAVTILFYPDELMRAVSGALPMAKKLEPWMIKGGLFAAVSMTILGIGLRGIGRLDGSGELWSAWTPQPRGIRPIAVGTDVVKKT